MDFTQTVKRMEKAIEAEPDKIRRWAMRKVLANTLLKMEVTQ